MDEGRDARGRRYGRLTPVAAPGKSTTVDFAHPLQSAWGNRVFSGAEFQAMLDAEREGMATFSAQPSRWPAG